MGAESTSAKKLSPSAATQPKKTSVLIADDHQIIRRGVRAIVEEMDGWEVCAEAATGQEAVQMAECFRPQVAVLDMTMPGFDGLEATRQIKSVAPETEILILTGHESEELVNQVFQAGARSYVLKTDGKEHLECALRALARHKPYFTTEVGEILFSEVLGKERSEEDEQTSTLTRLTSRDRRVVQLLAEGMGNKEVASTFGISIKTIETQRAAIMKKLRINTFSELVRYAVRNNIVSA